MCWVSSHGATVFLVTFDNSQLLGRLVLDASEWLIKDSSPLSGDIQQRLETRLPGRPRTGSSGVCEETPQMLLNILRAQDAPHPHPLHSKEFLVLMLAAGCDAGLFASLEAARASRVKATQPPRSQVLAAPQLACGNARPDPPLLRSSTQPHLETLAGLCSSLRKTNHLSGQKAKRFRLFCF